MTRKSVFFLAIILFITFMYMWYLTASQFYVKNYAPELELKGMCSTIISSIWKESNECCVDYDEKYLYGGNESSRFTIDYKFKDCVLNKGIDKKSATALFYTTRILGTPYINTPWRWGYGYDFGGGYR